MVLERFLKQIFLLFTLISSLGITNSFAQTITKVKAKTHKSKTPAAKTIEYFNGHKIITGPRGGRYYSNKKGNKIYI